MLTGVRPVADILDDLMTGCRTRLGEMNDIRL